MAVAGILACAVAILDVSLPRGSIVGFLTKMTLLGVAVTGILIGYTWVCDKCESYLHGRLDRLLSGSKLKRNNAVNPVAGAEPRPTEPKVGGDVTDTLHLCSCDRYVRSFRSPVLRNIAIGTQQPRTWHGQ